MRTLPAWCMRLCTALAVVALAANADEPAANRLFAFVGQKLKVEEFKPECKRKTEANIESVCIIMDSAFHAEYRVLKQVHGRYDGDTIRFDAFDHYGWPAFAHYEHVLLFVSRGEDGQWYHQKYQYFPVYETLDGGWAACGSADRFEPPTRRGPSTARPIAFKQPVVESLANLPPEKIDAWFPLSDWDHTNGQAVCRQGTPLAELFEAKKRGVLKARGLFE